MTALKAFYHLKVFVGSRPEATTSIQFFVGKGEGSVAARKFDAYLAGKIAKRFGFEVLVGNFHSNEMSGRQKTGSLNENNFKHSFPKNNSASHQLGKNCYLSCDWFNHRSTLGSPSNRFLILSDQACARELASCAFGWSHLH